MNKPLRQSGFAHVAALLLIILVIGAVVGGFLYVRSQNEKDKKAQAKITQLEVANKVPVDWTAYNLSTTKSVYLPKGYTETQNTYGQYVFRSDQPPNENSYPLDITVHVNSRPSINLDWSYKSYCQFNGMKWRPYLNKAARRTILKDKASQKKCANVVSASSNGINYYKYQSIDGVTVHVALVVKAGSDWYVLNLQKYLNNYAPEAVKAAVAGQTTAMTDWIEKIAKANS